MRQFNASDLKQYFNNHPAEIGKIVDFDKETDSYLTFDFTERNKTLSSETIAKTNLFTDWVSDQLKNTNSRYGIGGYNEHRTIYARSVLFNADTQLRRLHLGVDIWGPALTPVYNPVGGRVHSFNFNDHFGDYGATIILEHKLAEIKFYSLFGHLSLASLNNLTEGKYVPKGEHFTEFGIPAENGHWPPHLHYQLMFDMEGMRGDYPGVCAFSEREKFLDNCPDPKDILAQTFSKFV